jgi:hypothetical protein
MQLSQLENSYLCTKIITYVDMKVLSFPFFLKYFVKYDGQQ